MGRFIPPDWRDESVYPAKTDDWHLGAWAWEFLRRNPEYQKDFEHFTRLPAYNIHGGKTGKWSGTAASSDDIAELRYCERAILPGETLEEYCIRTGDDTPYFVPLEEHLTQKWKTDHLADPANDEGCYCLGYVSEYPKIIAQKSEFNPKEPEPENSYEITLRFDLRYSIENQLQEAKDILLSTREEGEKVKRSLGVQLEKLPIYLRTYDAKQTGATYEETGKLLFPQLDIELAKQRAYNAYKKAEELVMIDYQNLMKVR